MLLVAGCAGGRSTASPVATDQVDLPPSYRFVPAAIVVPVGTEVTWTNRDNFTHSVQLLDGPDRTDHVIRPGEACHASNSPRRGRSEYQCSLHPQNMKGTVTVAP